MYEYDFFLKEEFGRFWCTLNHPINYNFLTFIGYAVFTVHDAVLTFLGSGSSADEDEVSEA